ncbi:Protein SERAC1 [Colletotrichum orbiculare MAFF 240422]|uniref:Protein SERAC1 n=1 Tax=Colletotrichum orbiculare (strain 104-T / ATCC 96160 / CBS 514.97 / LARS 414 / MAFF 240422) TaxID=1213857 RepID=N4VSI2_COLOR|nr:Protein SERAC1 [Colletotrichum orbiculare MAFF 240422]
MNHLGQPVAAVAFTATVAVLLVLLVRLLQARSTPQPVKSNTNRRTAKDITFRIDDVPGETSTTTLETNLQSLGTKHSLELRETLSTLRVCSLARRDARFACATVIVRTRLADTELLTELQSLLKASGFRYRCDCTFYGITPLYENVSATSTACDVVAVPGLASHAVGSWKAPGDSDVWLRDWLPEDIPNIRVILYGYDTKLLKNDSASSIEDLGRRLLESLGTFRKSTNTQERPIILIGHSLGGLLIKEALVHSYRSTGLGPTYNSLHQYCCGMLFFGVPHLGLRNDALQSFVQGQPNEALITSIVVDDESEPSHFLARISDDFARCFHGETRIVCFYERYQSAKVEMRDGKLSKTGGKVLMVTKKSATSTGVTGVSENDVIPLEADHSGLVKFESRGQDTYLVVRERIRCFAAAAKDGPKSYDAKDSRGVFRQSSSRGTVVRQEGSQFGGQIIMNGGSLSQGNLSNVYNIRR